MGCTATICANCGCAAAAGAPGAGALLVAFGSSPGGNWAVAADVAIVMLAGVASPCGLLPCPQPDNAAMTTIPSEARTARAGPDLCFIVLSRPNGPDDNLIQTTRQ